MKYLITGLLLIIACSLSAQKWRPTEISVSYFGETITHPGIRAGVSYKLKNWHKHVVKKNKATVIHKGVLLQPSVGLFYHSNYQTGLFVLPELSLIRKKENGSYRSIGLGAGYLQTVLPNVYELNAGEEIVKVNGRNHHFLTSVSFQYGRNVNFTPLSVYVKPQLLMAIPNTAGSMQYIALEIGIQYRLAAN
jgi:hypothetical protein